MTPFDKSVPPAQAAQRRMAIGYARVSTDEQVKGYSLDHQRAVIIDWCARHQIRLVGIEVADGHGESGKDLDRPAVRRVHDRVESGDIGWVVVSKVDRLSRSLEDTCTLLEVWDARGVRVVAPGDGLDDPAGKTHIVMLLRSWLAEWERNRIVARVRPGLLARARAGLPLGRIPIGYRMVTDPAAASPASRRSQRLVPDPVTAPIVRALFAKAAQEEWGARKLASIMTLAFPGTPLSYGLVAAVLRNPVYLGTLAARVGDEHVLRLNNHEALISEADFYAVQRRLQVRKREHEHRERNTHTDSWLGGIAHCGVCGQPVTIRQGRAAGEETFYLCRSRTTGPGCGAPQWPLDETDTQVVDRLYAKLERDLVLVARLVDQAIEKIPAHLDGRRQAADALLKRCDQEEHVHLEALEQGAMAPQDFNTAEKARQAGRTSARQLLDETDGLTFLADLWRQRRHEPSRMHPQVAALMPAARELHDVSAGLSPEPTSVSTQAPNTVRLWLPLPLVFARMSIPDRRRMLRAATTIVRLMNEGAYPEVVCKDGVEGYAELGCALVHSLAVGQCVLVSPAGPATPI